MTIVDDSVLIRVPTESSAEFQSYWKSLRLADGQEPEADLTAPETVERFDANTLVEWFVPLTQALTPLIVAALGYIVSRRGEVEITTGGMTVKFRNISPRQIKEIVQAIEARDARPKSKKRRK